MASNTFRRLLPVVCAGLLSMTHVPAPSFGQQTRGTAAAEIELSGITFEYAVLDGTGEIVWATPAPDKPNVIPAESQRLRFKATVNNREPGTRIRLRAVLRELCPPPDEGKHFLSKLRHLNATDPGNLTPDPTDDEEQVVKPDRTVSIEILVHCDTCAEAVCGKRCSMHLDHLGEGPHVVDLTATDPPPAARETSSQAARHSDSASATYSIVRVNLISVCPRMQKQKRARNTSRRRAFQRTPTAPRALSSSIR